MSESFGPNFVSLTDEDGNEFELEHVDTLEYNGSYYLAFYPVIEQDEEVTDIDMDSDDYGLIILKQVEVDGELELETIEDEAELELIFDKFTEQIFADEDEDD